MTIVTNLEFLKTTLSLFHLSSEIHIAYELKSVVNLPYLLSSPLDVPFHPHLCVPDPTLLPFV